MSYIRMEFFYAPTGNTETRTLDISDANQLRVIQYLRMKYSPDGQNPTTANVAVTGEFDGYIESLKNQVISYERLLEAANIAIPPVT